MSEGTRKPFSTAVGLLRRTTPFLLLNLGVYALFFVGTVIWLAAFGGLAYLFAERVPLLAIIAFVIGVGGPWGLIALARRYLLYLVQGAHIAVATKLLLDGQLPDGKSQVEYGRSVVKQLFRDVSILFLIDRMIDGTVKAFTRRFVRIVDMLPLGGAVSSLARIGATIINRSLSYVDEAILSYAIAKDQPNVWRSGRHGLILYAQAYKPILGTAVRIWLLGRLFWLGALLIVGVPGILLVMAFMPEAEAMQILLQLLVIVGALLVASLLTRAVFEPFAAVYTLTAYHRAIDGLEVNAVWDRRLQSVSKRFRELVGKAQEADEVVDPLDQVDVPQQEIDAANGGATPQPQGGATTTQVASQPSGGAGFGGLARGGTRGGLGGMIGGMISQAASNVQQPAQAPPAQPPAQSPAPQPSAPQPPAPQPSAPQPPPDAPQPPPAQAPPPGHAPPPQAPAPPPSGGQAAPPPQQG